MKDSIKPSLFESALSRIRNVRPEVTDTGLAQPHGTADGVKGRSALMKYAMWACCAVMLVPLAGYLLSGGTVTGLWQNVSVFAPLLLCVAVHLVLCKMIMGKSCHGASDKEGGNAVTDSHARPARAAMAAVSARLSSRKLRS